MPAAESAPALERPSLAAARRPMGEIPVERAAHDRPRRAAVRCCSRSSSSARRATTNTRARRRTRAARPTRRQARADSATTTACPRRRRRCTAAGIDDDDAAQSRRRGIADDGDAGIAADAAKPHAGCAPGSPTQRPTPAGGRATRRDGERRGARARVPGHVVGGGEGRQRPRDPADDGRRRHDADGLRHAAARALARQRARRRGDVSRAVARPRAVTRAAASRASRSSDRDDRLRDRDLRRRR